MNHETIALIDRLAAKLGTTSDTLIGWFVARALASPEAYAFEAILKALPL